MIETRNPIIHHNFKWLKLCAQYESEQTIPKTTRYSIIKGCVMLRQFLKILTVSIVGFKKPSCEASQADILEFVFL